MASIVISGDTSGTVTLAAPTVAGTQSYTLPTAVPAANGYALTSTTGGVMSWAAAGGSPGGSTTQIQYNNAGAFAGSANMTFDGTRLTTAALTSDTNTVYVDATNHRLGIGTASPAVKLNILSTNSEFRFGDTGLFVIGTGTTASTNYISFAAYPGVVSGLITVSSDNASSQNRMVFANPNGTVGTITTSGSATAYNTSSDYRLKENVQPMTGALARVALLKPCTYTWKSDGKQSEGFIAHELQSVIPDAVSGEKDAINEDGSIKSQGIDTSFLVATLTAAIQELSAANEALTARIAALEAK